VLLAMLAFSTPAAAQNWNFAGPLAAPSRIISVIADPRADSVLYVTAPGGGIWKSQDGGVSWSPLVDSGPSLQFCTLAFDPRFPDILYAGTGDDQSPRPMQGVARSDDAGKMWTFLTRFSNQPVCSIAVDPSNSQRILAASADGLFLSTDSAGSWTRVLDSPVSSVAVDAQGVIYAGMPREDAAGAREKTITHSRDDGATWVALPLPPNLNAPTAETNWVGVFAGDGKVYAVVSYQLNAIVPGITASSAQAPLSSADFYRSVDGGATWSAPVSVAQLRPPASLLSAGGGALYLAGNALLGSADYGTSWSTIRTNESEYHAIAMTGGMLMLGGERGLTGVSLSLENRAREISPLPLGQFFGANIDSSNGLWGAGQAGFFGPLSKVIDTRISGTDAAGAVGAAATGSNILAAGNNAVYVSTDSGAQFSTHRVIPDGELRAPFPPLLLEPVVTSSAYVAGRRLYRTTNNGTSWTPLAVVDPDPTHVVIALAMAPASRATLYAATACLPEVSQTRCSPGSLLWRSANSGASWTQLPPITGYVNRLAVDPRQTNTVYAAVGAFPAGPSASAGLIPGDVLRSMNGQAWTSIQGNLPDTSVNAIVIDPTSLPAAPLPGTGIPIPGIPIPGMPIPGFPGAFNQPAQTIYIGTDHGVFVTFNAGGLWTDISSNLPPSSITDIALRQPGNTLAAATFGRGIYTASTAGLAAGIIATRLSLDVTLMHGTSATLGVPLLNGSTSAANSWRLNSLQSWITVPQPNGTLSPGSSAQVAFRVSAEDLGPGTHVGNLELVSGPYFQNIVVIVHVTAAPAYMRIVGPSTLTGIAGSTLPALQVLLSDTNQVPLAGIPVYFSIISGGGSLSALTARTNAAGVAATALTLPASSGTVRVVATSGDLSVTFAATSIPPPTLLANSAIDGVTLNPYTPLGPGSIVLITGQNLAETTGAAGGESLPTVVHTTQVLLITSTNEIALPLLFVAPGQVKAVLPHDIPPGSYALRVEVGSLRSNEIQVAVAPFAPGIFSVAENGRGLGLFIKEDGSIVSTANPADRGTRVTFYAGGLGAVNSAGRTVTTPRVFFDSYPAEVSYSGVVPGVAGRYQVTVRVPALVSPATNISVSLTIGGYSSNRVTIPVR
jgi:uncharacterized protein (TIGR03437 family)